MYYWRVVPTYTVWLVNTEDDHYITFIFILAQFGGWISIYGGCIVMSVTEILGIKQVSKVHCVTKPYNNINIQ